MIENDRQAKVLSVKQQKFVAELLRVQTIVNAAKAVGITEKTAHRWLKLPQVQAVFHEAQRRMFDESIARFLVSTGTAWATLMSIMRDTEAPAGPRINAAKFILEQGIEIFKLGEIEQRLAELEGRQT